MYKPICVLMMLLIASPLAAAPGKIILNGGKVLKGDIEKLPDGSCWLTQKSGSIKFDCDEISKVILYSNDDQTSARFVRSLKRTPAVSKPAGRSRATPYDGLIHEAARAHDVDPALIKAVIKAESNFNPADTSVKGACGLMQLMPATAKILGVDDIYSPRENIHAGTRFLRDMLRRFNGDREKAVAAYNAGPGAVDRYRDVPPYRETRAYVANVFRYYDRYHNTGSVVAYTDEAGRLTLSNVH